MKTILSIFSKSLSDGMNSYPLARTNPKLAHFFRAHSNNAPEESSLSKTTLEPSPSGSAPSLSGRFHEEAEMQTRALFLSMSFVALASHTSFAAICLAHDSSLASIPVALLAAVFWDRAILHARRSYQPLPSNNDEKH